MVVVTSPSTVSLDHLYAKKVDLLEDDLFSSSSDFLNTWNQVSLTWRAAILWRRRLTYLVDQSLFFCALNTVFFFKTFCDQKYEYIRQSKACLLAKIGQSFSFESRSYIFISFAWRLRIKMIF